MLFRHLILPLTTMALVLGLGQPAMAESYEPEYEIIKRHDKVQLRCYKAFTVAETTMSDDYRPASYTGFKRLADFIFGKNDKNEKMAMTKPVSMRPSPKDPTGSWNMFFVMPPNYKDLGKPQPQGQNIKIYDVKPFCALNIRFSGWANNDDLAEYTAQLLKVAKAHKYELTGEESHLLVFNQPMIPGPFRRNEVILKVKKPKP
tara:strand:- start:150 stop:758 length:609 start_codon:yes stop_codon:yes gene_type:complete